MNSKRLKILKKANAKGARVAPECVTIPRDVWEQQKREIDSLYRTAKNLFERLEAMKEKEAIKA